MIELTLTNVHDPLKFDIGDDWFLYFECNDAQNEPLDLTGAQIEWLLKPYGSETPTLTLTLADGISVIPPDDTNSVLDKLLVQVTAAQSAGIAPGFYRDRLRIITNADIHTTQSRGGLRPCKPN